MQASRLLPWLTALLLALFACASGALAATGPARAAVASKVDLWPNADCSAHADLDVTFTGAGVHYEYGNATDAAGNTIGTFGPLNADADSYSGRYQINITTAQPPNSFIGSYGWVGSNPPTPGGAAEFFVLYNCTSKTVVYRCTGAYGKCPANAKDALHVLAIPPTLPPTVPTLSAPAMIFLGLLLAGAGAVVLRGGRGRAPPGLGT